MYAYMCVSKYKIYKKWALVSLVTSLLSVTRGYKAFSVGNPEYPSSQSFFIKVLTSIA